MSQPNPMLATILRKGARALAGYASADLAEPAARDAEPLAAGPFSGWQSVLAVRVDELAAAVEAGRPELFGEQVRWAKAVLAARGVPAEAFRVALESLRQVLAEELPHELTVAPTGFVDQALAGFDREPDGLSPRLAPDTPHGRLAAEYLLAVLEGDRRQASQLVLRRADQGESISDLYLRVLLPAQEELGRMWLIGEINVAEEHFATSTTKMVMAQLLAHAPQRPANGRSLLAAAVVGNQHELGLQAVADFFEMGGWRVIYLGANVPVVDLVQAVQFYRPDLVGLSVSLTVQLPLLKETVAAIRANPPDAPLRILVGGHALKGADDLAVALGADGYATDPVAAVAWGNSLT